MSTSAKLDTNLGYNNKVSGVNHDSVHTPLNNPPIIPNNVESAPLNDDYSFESEIEDSLMEMEESDMPFYEYDVMDKSKKGIKTKKEIWYPPLFFLKGETDKGNTGEFLIQQMKYLMNVSQKKYLFIKNPKGEGGKPPFNGVTSEKRNKINPYLHLDGEVIAKIGPKKKWRGTKKGFTNCSTAILECISILFGNGKGIINGVPTKNIKYAPFIKLFNGVNWTDVFDKFPEFGLKVDSLLSAERGDILSQPGHRLLITGKPTPIEGNTRLIRVPVIHACPPTGGIAVKEGIKKYSIKKISKLKVGRFFDYSHVAPRSN